MKGDVMKLFVKASVLLVCLHLVICAGASCAIAAEDAERNWTLYMRSGSGTEYYYDKGAVIETPERTLQVWRKRVFKPDAAQKEIVTFDQLTCDFREQYRSLQMTVTYWDGRSQTYSKISPWAHIFTNSPEQYLVDEHCGKANKPAPAK